MPNKKDAHSQGREGVCPVRTRVLYFLAQKLRVCQHDQGGVEPVWTFCEHGGRGQFFAILC